MRFLLHYRRHSTSDEEVVREVDWSDVTTMPQALLKLYSALEVSNAESIGVVCKVVGVSILGPSYQHQFKLASTALYRDVTGEYRRYLCQVCGCEGRKYAHSDIVRVGKYSKSKYNTCQPKEEDENETD